MLLGIMEVCDMREYGYVRISSIDQNEDRQMIEMEKAEIKEDRIYVDKQSGKDFNRPQYKEMVAYIFLKLRLIVNYIGVII